MPRVTQQQRTSQLKPWIDKTDGYFEDQTKSNTAIDSITIEATDNSGQVTTKWVTRRRRLIVRQH